MAVTTAEKPSLGEPLRPLRRSASDCLLGGVCGGIAIRLGIRERTVRALFGVSVAAFGIGAVVYAVLWLLTTRSGEDNSIAERLSLKRREAQTFLLSTSVVVLLLVALYSLHLGVVGGFLWSFVICALAGLAIWRGSSPDERAQLDRLIGETPWIGAASARGWKAVLLRVLPGLVMVIVGFNILGHVGGIWDGAIPALLGTAALVFGFLILLAPWWLHTARALARERRERVRVEERSAMVAHIHDSVLQTLTLIERVAHSEDEVIRLARNQERELREWLFDPAAPQSSAEGAVTCVATARSIENDIENDYGVRVELVVVGDCELDDGVRALLAAGREAAINAAKWSGAPSISIFLEIETSTVSMFVRDTGRGFDLDAVAEDRHGIALSIEQRMMRNGGNAVVRSTPGSGTEVELVLPRHAS
jgi:signal transduction histidine kinase